MKRIFEGILVLLITLSAMTLAIGLYMLILTYVEDVWIRVVFLSFLSLIVGLISINVFN